MQFHIAHIITHPRSHGLRGYQEIIDSLQWGLRALGHEVSYALNAISPSARNIIFGFHMLPVETIRALPPGTIAYNFEQLSIELIPTLKPSFAASAQHLTVWDYSASNLAVWSALRPRQPAVHVPVGWAPVLERIAPAADQDIDVLFYGMPGFQRLSVFEQAAGAGLVSVFACGLYGPARDALIARAKLVLNVHLYEQTRLFEVVRVSYLLANAKAVVAVVFPDTRIEPDLVPALARCTAAEAADTCSDLLEDSPRRAELGARGQEVMRQRDIRSILQRALDFGG